MGQGCAQVVLAFVLLCSSHGNAADDPRTVDNTVHNLSASGIGALRSDTETEICIFCHAPHGTTGEVPLWNHQMSTAAYKPYNSPTIKATMGQPTGSSRLCLSCHDGTVALGLVASRSTPIPMRNGNSPIPAGLTRIGTDLNRHHPFSFTYDSALAVRQGQLRDPTSLTGQVKLDQYQQVQCISCHDPHSNLYGKFLVMPGTDSALCLECHALQGWGTSAHATSQARIVGTAQAQSSGVEKGLSPQRHGNTVAQRGCESCHATHGAGAEAHLLNYARPDDNCLVCHDGSVAAKNILGETHKASAHASLGANLLSRDATRSTKRSAGQDISCLGCHSAHATGSSAVPTSGRMAGSLAKVKGMSAAGGIVQTASQEYEICFRCHADTATRNASGLPRQFSQSNIRLQFSPANASYHPVIAAAKAGDDPTLISPWTPATQLTCTDCHNNDQGPGANGNGPRGPHGSRFAHLLERNLTEEDFQPETHDAYALCYKCHDQNTVLGDQLHRSHVRDQKAACTTCHDPHGVKTQPHLINFNTIYVKPLNGLMVYMDRGPDRSTCTLTCHGKAHDKSAYP